MSQAFERAHRCAPDKGAFSGGWSRGPILPMEGDAYGPRFRSKLSNLLRSFAPTGINRYRKEI